VLNVICSGHTLLFEDSIDVSHLLEKNGFPSPLKEMRPSVSQAVEGASHSEVDPKKASNLQKRKHSTADERYDEMGQILEPWRVSYELPDRLSFISVPHAVSSICFKTVDAMYFMSACIFWTRAFLGYLHSVLLVL